MFVEDLELYEVLELIDIIYEKDSVKVTDIQFIDGAISVKLDTKWDFEEEDIWFSDDELMLEDFSIYSDYRTLPHSNRKYKKFMYEKFGKVYADKYFSEY